METWAGRTASEGQCWIRYLMRAWSGLGCKMVSVRPIQLTMACSKIAESWPSKKESAKEDNDGQLTAGLAMAAMFKCRNNTEILRME